MLILQDEGPEFIARLREASPDLEIVEADAEDAKNFIADADGLYGSLTPELLSAAPNLKWVQFPSASMERFLFDDLIASDVVVTNLRGIYNDFVSEHAISLMLALTHNLHVARDRQKEKAWDPQATSGVSVSGLTAGIVGLGGIGAEVARRAAFLGMRIVAVDPRVQKAPDFVEHLWRPNELNILLEQADIVAICAPETPETRGLMDRAAFKQMKESSFLVNVGRGAIVKLNALVEALQNEWIAGAALDVFEEEPLPESHSLWSQPNAIITPHVASACGDVTERRRQVVIDNARRFAHGEPFINVVDKKAWY